jgi:hypothetical protein
MSQDLLQELAQQQQQQNQLVGMQGNMVSFQTGQGQNVMIPAELLSSQEDPLGSMLLHNPSLMSSSLGGPQAQVNPQQQMQQLLEAAALQQQQQQQQLLASAGDMQLAAPPPAPPPPPPPPPRPAPALSHTGLTGAGVGAPSSHHQAPQAGGPSAVLSGSAAVPAGTQQPTGTANPYSRLQQQLRALQQLQRQQHQLQDLPVTTTMVGTLLYKAAVGMVTDA